MAKKVTSNYTAEMTASLVDAYDAVVETNGSGSQDDQEARDAVVEQFADDFGFHAASIRSKLVRETNYIAKTTLTKQGGKPEKKESIVSQIAGFIGMTEEACDSLSKPNKAVLQGIRDTFTGLSDALALATAEPVDSDSEGEGDTA